MTSALTPLWIVWAISAVAMTLGWAWQRRRANAGIVDVLWAAGLACSAVVTALFGDGSVLARSLLGVLGGAWGTRLAWHLWRRVSRETEDGRYRALREHWQGSQLKFFLFFQAQAALVLLFSLPFLAASRASHASPMWPLLAGIVWLACVAGESVADGQLARFRADPANRGRACRAGLWRYSRHPNYFFEWLHWFSYVLLAVGSPWWGLAWLGPVLMYVFLRYLSGVPFTEKQALRTRGEDYAEYQRTTPMLFPWFPRTP
jgi:steroid 5-alpha reductase family enzyme